MHYARLTTEDYCHLVRQNHGTVFLLNGNEQALLAPLKVASQSRRLLVTPRDAMAYQSELNDRYKILPEIVFMLPGATLYASGVPLISHSIAEVLCRHEKFLTHIIDAPPCKTLSISPPPLVMGPLEAFNYSHWIFEGLPKLGLYKRVYGQYPETVLITTKKTNFHVDSVSFISKEIEVLFQTKFPCLSQTCVVTTSLAQTVSKIHPSVFKFYDDHLRERSTEGPSVRLYISRKHAAYRRILNEEELIDGLRGFGFTLVLPEDMSFAEQVTLFRNAECVISAHGAGLTNLVFSKSLNFVAEIFSSGFPARSVYAHASRHKKAVYLAASGVPVDMPVSGPKDPEGWPGHKSFMVDIPRFLEAIAAILG